MELTEIIKKFLIDNDYDGLYLNGDCACGLDNLIPCHEPSPNCEAGYKTKCGKNGEYDYHIGSIKPEEAQKSNIS